MCTVYSFHSCREKNFNLINNFYFIFKKYDLEHIAPVLFSTDNLKCSSILNRLLSVLHDTYLSHRSWKLTCKEESNFYNQFVANLLWFTLIVHFRPIFVIWEKTLRLHRKRRACHTKPPAGQFWSVCAPIRVNFS